MSKLLESKSGWENRIYIGTCSVFSCHVETVCSLVPSPNLPKSEESRQPQCSEDKESAIVEALKHFKMI